MRNPYFSALTFITLLIFSIASHATIVRLTTSLGEIDVNLYDELTPLTVENFLSYVESQAYDNSIIHRSVPGFIIQGGGFSYTPETLVQSINTGDPVANEPFYSNIRGTIAMAKLGSNPNSATNQWFFNLSNSNASNLDNQNGGFTVFGEVIEGMDKVDEIAGLDTFNLAANIGLTDVPLRDYTSEDVTNNVQVAGENLLVILSIQVIDNAIDTLDGVEPTEALSSSSSGGGGMLNFGLLIFLFSITTIRLILRKKPI